MAADARTPVDLVAVTDCSELPNGDGDRATDTTRYEQRNSRGGHEDVPLADYSIALRGRGRCAGGERRYGEAMHDDHACENGESRKLPVRQRDEELRVAATMPNRCRLRQPVLHGGRVSSADQQTANARASPNANRGQRPPRVPLDEAARAAASSVAAHCTNGATRSGPFQNQRLHAGLTLRSARAKPSSKIFKSKDYRP